MTSRQLNSAASIIIGLTAKTIIVASATASALLRVAAMPSSRSAELGPLGLDARIAAAGTILLLTNPRMTAVAMFPAPMNATRSSALAQSGDAISVTAKQMISAACRSNIGFAVFEDEHA
jgi:hypothetical protein